MSVNNNPEADDQIALDLNDPVLTFECYDCGDEFPVDAIDRTVKQATGRDVCGECAEENYEPCADCRDLCHRDNLTDVGGSLEYHYVCTNCWDNYSTCDDCGETVPERDTHTVGSDDHTVCDGCYTNYESCEICEHEQRDVHRRYVDGSYMDVCDTCYDNLEDCPECGSPATDPDGGSCCERSEYDEDDEDTIEPNARVQDTSQFFRTAWDTKRERAGHTLLYLGYELEVELGRSSLSYRDASGQVRADYMLHHYDGSLSNGIEFVSMPMTYEFFKEHRDEMGEKWNGLRRAGVRSHNTQTCGMHVHLSRKSFTQYHLLKFMRLIYDNPEFIMRVSQRTADRLDQWSSLTAENPTLPRLVRKAKSGENISGRERYVAVNLENRNTVELRIFRGNLRPERFAKNVEFCVAAYHFSKQGPLSGMTAPAFVAWVAENRSEYPNLAAFFKERNLCAASTVTTEEEEAA